MISRLVATVATAVAFTSAFHASVAPQEETPLASKGYSLSEVIHNRTSHTLWVAKAEVDNGARIEPHAASVAPGADLSITALNQGNGIQLWLTMMTDDGVPVRSDIDVPRVASNWMTVSIDSDAARSTYGLDRDGTRTAGGTHPVFSYTLVDTAPGACSVRAPCVLRAASRHSRSTTELSSCGGSGGAPILPRPG